MKGKFACEHRKQVTFYRALLIYFYSSLLVAFLILIYGLCLTEEIHHTFAHEDWIWLALVSRLYENTRIYLPEYT